MSSPPPPASPPTPNSTTNGTKFIFSSPFPAVTTPTNNTFPKMSIGVEMDDSGMGRGTLNGIIIGVVLGSVGMLIIGGIFILLHRRGRRRKLFKDINHFAPPQPKGSPLKPPVYSTGLGPERPYIPPSPGISLALSQSTFTYEELATATDGFSKVNLLGQGGFGYVHKGVLPDGKIVAVKQLKIESRQGEREFHAEVEVISRVHHRHLVSLVGYCISGKDRSTMDWPTRMKIAIGSAKGLTYLHEDCHPKIIHRDIKAANILLDDNFEAKVADFGLAKFSSDADTHVSTRVMGTFGYMAPEYAASGKLTEKSDVFSFGVVLLELITGRKPVDKTESFTDDSMVEWAKPLLSQALENDNFNGLVDPWLEKNYNLDEMIQMIACAASCVRNSARRRPRMSQVVRALEGNISLDDLNEGSSPGHSRVFGPFEGSSYDTNQYNEDLKKFEKLALESQEQGTSEYSAPSSEYGQHPSASTSSGQQNTQEMEMGNVKVSNHGSGVSS